jgi:hypothetical protein
MNKLERYYKKEERERILGIIEFVRDELGDSVYENYAKKVVNRVIQAINEN